MIKHFLATLLWLPEAPAVENNERWMELCTQASKEQDPERLFRLVQEINNLLEEKEARLKKSRQTLRVDPSEGHDPKA